MVGFGLDMNMTRADYDRADAYNEFETITFKWVTKVGVNDPCPCKSGKKFKKCCMEFYKKDNLC